MRFSSDLRRAVSSLTLAPVARETRNKVSIVLSRIDGSVWNLPDIAKERTLSKDHRIGAGGFAGRMLAQALTKSMKQGADKSRPKAYFRGLQSDDLYEDIVVGASFLTTNRCLRKDITTDDDIDDGSSPLTKSQNEPHTEEYW